MTTKHPPGSDTISHYHYCRCDDPRRHLTAPVPIATAQVPPVVLAPVRIATAGPCCRKKDGEKGWGEDSNLLTVVPSKIGGGGLSSLLSLQGCRQRQPRSSSRKKGWGEDGNWLTLMLTKMLYICPVARPTTTAQSSSSSSVPIKMGTPFSCEDNMSRYDTIRLPRPLYLQVLPCAAITTVVVLGIVVASPLPPPHRPVVIFVVRPPPVRDALLLQGKPAQV